MSLESSGQGGGGDGDLVKLTSLISLAELLISSIDLSFVTQLTTTKTNREASINLVGFSLVSNQGGEGAFSGRKRTQHSPCGHPAITDIRYYGQNSYPLQKRFDWKQLPLLRSLAIMDTKQQPEGVPYSKS